MSRPVLIQSDATRMPLADGSVDLVLTSPPYADARSYGIGAQRECSEWVEWMLTVVEEMTRVCSGLVLVNCAGVTRDRNYWPACEGLMWEWWKRGGNLWRPAYWHRVGIPGSGGTQWLRADIEYVIPFKRDREWLPWSDSCANGHPPVYSAGGATSHRRKNGQRANQGLRELREVAGSHEIPFGPNGELAAVLQSEVLRQGLCGRSEGSHEQGVSRGREGSHYREEDGQTHSLRVVREFEESPHPSQRRKPTEQQQDEPEGSLQLMSSEAASTSPEMQHLREAACGAGVLRHAPATIPEAWRSAGGETESASPEKKMYNHRQNGRRRLERGNEKGGCYALPAIANPGNLLKIPVGGGMLGSKLAHENEAPFPQKLAEWFIRGWCRPGGIVLDPFSGSGTTVAAAIALGRRGIGMDLRWSQCELGRRRNAHAQAPLPGMEGAAA